MLITTFVMLNFKKTNLIASFLGRLSKLPEKVLEGIACGGTVIMRRKFFIALRGFASVYVIILLLTSITAFSQSEMSLTLPIVYSTVTVRDNWTPPTAPGYKEYIDGSAIRYGASLNYLFRLGALIKDENFKVSIGAGYFNQQFNVTRPFNYSSPIYIGFFTEKYAYHCLQGSLGMAYNFELNLKYSIITQLNYNWVHSFNQKYTPTYEDYPSEHTSSQINFGGTLLLSIGVQRKVGKSFSAGAGIVVPLFTKWRNDKIFEDDPTTFSHPEFSLGVSVSLVYHLRIIRLKQQTL